MRSALNVALSVTCMTLVAAGLLKIGSPHSFGEQIVAYDIVPPQVARPLGYLLPVAEILAGGLALFVPQVAVACSLLFLLFGFAIAANLLRGRRDLRCACFGPTGQHFIRWAYVWRNLGLALMSVAAAYGASRPSLLEFQVGTSLVLIVIAASAVRNISGEVTQRT